MTKIAVIIPLYNREASIAAAIDSVLAQTESDFEIVVVDDGSTDRGPKIVAAVDDPRVRLIRQAKRRGGNAARNLGIRSSTAPIICFLDSDDLFYPNKLATMLSIFDGRPNVDAVIDSYRTVYPDGRKPKDRINPRIDDRDDLLEALFRRRLWKATPSISVRREAATHAGLFDETLRRRQDYDFLVRLIDCANVISISNIGWQKTRSDDSITREFDGFIPSVVELWNRHPRYYDDPRFRRGLGADVAHHWLKEVRHRRFDQLRRERAMLTSRVGRAGVAKLVASGLVELVRARRARRSVQARAASSGRNGGTGA